jgi:hypothetical protein
VGDAAECCLWVAAEDCTVTALVVTVVGCLWTAAAVVELADTTMEADLALGAALPGLGRGCYDKHGYLLWKIVRIKQGLPRYGKRKDLAPMFSFHCLEWLQPASVNSLLAASNSDKLAVREGRLGHRGDQTRLRLEGHSLLRIGILLQYMFNHIITADS